MESSSSDSNSSSESEIESLPSRNNSPQKRDLRFAIPQGFSELDVLKKACMSKEELTSDDELWLVKLPLCMSPQSLNGTVCRFEGGMQIKSNEEPKDGLPFVYDVQVKQAANTPSDLSVLLPSKTVGRLQPAGRFRGEVDIRKILKLPSKRHSLPETPKQKHRAEDLADGLLKGSAIKRKATTSESEPTPKKCKVSEETPVTNRPVEQVSKKKKKKHKNKDKPESSPQKMVENLDHMETDATNGDSVLENGIKKKKKSKKDRKDRKEHTDSILDSSQEKEIKKEDINFNLDSSSSEKKKKKKKKKAKVEAE